MSDELENIIQWIDDQTLELAAVFITSQLTHSDILIMKIVMRLFFDFRMNSFVYIYKWNMFEHQRQILKSRDEIKQQIIYKKQFYCLTLNAKLSCKAKVTNLT